MADDARRPAPQADNAARDHANRNNNRPGRVQPALIQEPFIQKSFGFLFEWPVLLIEFALSLTWFFYELYLTIPKIDAYKLVVHQARREMLDRVEIDIR